MLLEVGESGFFNNFMLPELDVNALLSTLHTSQISNTFTAESNIADT